MNSRLISASSCAVAADARQHVIGTERRRRDPVGPAGCGLRRPSCSTSCAEPPRVERLGQVFVHAGREAALAIAFHRVRGHRDDRHVRAPVSRSRSRIAAVASKPPISGICTSISTTSNAVALERVERFAAVAGDRHLVTAPFEQARREPLVDRVVLGEQHVQAPLRQIRRQHRRRQRRRADRRRARARGRSRRAARAARPAW